MFEGTIRSKDMGYMIEINDKNLQDILNNKVVGEELIIYIQSYERWSSSGTSSFIRQTDCEKDLGCSYKMTCIVRRDFQNNDNILTIRRNEQFGDEDIMSGAGIKFTLSE